MIHEPTPHTAHAAVAARALQIGYEAHTVLRGIDLRVDYGEIRVVLGPSGCGKSTLLRHLVGLLAPQAGEIEVLGQPVRVGGAAPTSALLGRIGVLFQSGALLGSLTAAENVALPLHQRTDYPKDLIDEVTRLKLALVGLAEAAHLTPPQLSGGMRKRVALARAMALDPEVLFCDEPSAGLDPVAAADLDRLLVSLRDQFGTTLVVVTHELASIGAIADKVLMLQDGGIVADGPLPEVRQDPRAAIQRFFGRRPSLDVAFATSLHTRLQPPEDT